MPVIPLAAATTKYLSPKDKTAMVLMRHTLVIFRERGLSKHFHEGGHGHDFHIRYVGYGWDCLWQRCKRLSIHDNATGGTLDYEQIYSSTAFSGPITFNTITFFDTQAPGSVVLSGNYDITFSYTSSPLGSDYPIAGTGTQTFFDGVLGGPILAQAFQSQARLSFMIRRWETS